jgi:transcription antitermination factor NusG
MYREEHTWLVIQTYFKHELDVGAFLKEKGINYFIPMGYKEKTQADGKTKRILAPIIHNYVFVENKMPVREFKKMLAECYIPLHLLRNKGSEQPCEISNREMFEFRMLCDPQFDSQPSIEIGTDVSVGKEVEVVHGHFAGIRGRLVRKQKQYWFVKTVVGISVVLRITRWFCKPVKSQ